MATLNFNVLKSQQGIIKVLCVLFGAVCLGLFVEKPVSSSAHFTRLCIGTFIGYLIVTGGYIVGYVTGVKTRYQETIHNFSGCVLYLVIGIIILNDALDLAGDYKKYGIATGVFGLSNAVLYAIDTYFAYKN